MPLFRRPDGDLVRDLAPVRRMMPYLMRGRNESIVFHESTWDVTQALQWLRARNEKTAPEDHATIFQLFLWACGRVMHERPGLNRFVVNGRIYQRRGAFVSFAAKKAFRDDAPLVTVKLEFPKDEPFDAAVRRIRAAVGEGRAGKERRVDKEVALVLKFPGFVVRAVMAVLRWLDRHNLLPRGMIEPDPMYASLFAANIGSVGLDAPFHHLYEYGTISAFGVMGRVRKVQTTLPDGSTAVRDTLSVRWSLDERINDGFYAARSLEMIGRVMEDPAAQVDG